MGLEGVTWFVELHSVYLDFFVWIDFYAGWRGDSGANFGTRICPEFWTDDQRGFTLISALWDMPEVAVRAVKAT